METNERRVVLDYRGRNDHGILDEVRDFLLTKRDDIAVVEARVDTKKFADKIVLYSQIVGCSAHVSKCGKYWKIDLTPPSCKIGQVI